MSIDNVDKCRHNEPMTTTQTTKPATSGKCGVVGCSHAADFETQRRIGRNSWTVSLSCFDHASDAEINAMVSA